MIVDGRRRVIALLLLLGLPVLLMQKQCTTGKERPVKRWEHEAVVDAMQVRLEHDPAMMSVRRQTIEHPFRTLKYWSRG